VAEVVQPHSRRWFYGDLSSHLNSVTISKVGEMEHLDDDKWSNGDDAAYVEETGEKENNCSDHGDGIPYSGD